MKTILLLFISAPSFLQMTSAQTTFQKIFTSGDEGNSVQQTSDGGYIIAGTSSSTDPFGNYTGYIYLLKTDANGNTLWTKTFGGGSFDGGHAVRQTSEGGYVIAGTTVGDVYLIKTDASGNTLWTKTFGGSENDEGYSVQQTIDGGYIIAGTTESYGANWGLYGNIYLIKTNFNGDTLWTKTYGGVSSEEGNSIQQTFDGGYIITGYTQSFGSGYGDGYLIKTNANGDTLWTKVILSTEWGRSVKQTNDKGYIITGGLIDGIELVMTDSNGVPLWTKYFGNYGRGYSVQQVSDGGFIIAGTGYDGISYKVYLIKTNYNGTSLWIKSFNNGGGASEGHSVQQTSDGGFIIAGKTGGGDVYLIKTDANGNVTTEIESRISYLLPQIAIFPNPTTGTLILKKNSGLEIEKINIYNPLGQKVFERAIKTSNVNSFTIDVNSLAAGIYNVQIATDKGILNKLVAIEKIK